MLGDQDIYTYIPCSLAHRRSDGVGIRLRQTDKIAERNLESDCDEHR